MENVWILLLESTVINCVYSCIFASRQTLGCHKRDAHKNAHWSELRPLLAWFANPALPRKRRAPAWLEVGVGAPELFPQTAKHHFKEGFITRLLILSSVLSISALIRKASTPTPRWRLSWLKLLMVTTMRQSSRFLKHHKAKMLIACERQTFLLAKRPSAAGETSAVRRLRCWYMGATWATKHFGRYVKWREDILFWRNPVGSVKVSRTRTKYL